jgi:AraC-like DNA-binding protein
MPLGEPENAFGDLRLSSPAVGEACREIEAEIQQKAEETLRPQTLSCRVGLQFVAAPVVVGDRHIATWIGGQVLERTPMQAGFYRVTKHVARSGMAEQWPRTKATSFRDRVLTQERFHASTQLLDLFSQHLGEAMEHWQLFSQPDEPKCVTRAKEFIHAHVSGPVPLPQVTVAARVSPSHFRQVFQASTGMTLPEYLCSLRVKRAKTLLADFLMPLSEVKDAAGFGSDSEFTAVFRKSAGISPQKYRDAQHQRFMTKVVAAPRSRVARAVEHARSWWAQPRSAPTIPVTAASGIGAAPESLRGGSAPQDLRSK